MIASDDNPALAEQEHTNQNKQANTEAEYTVIQN